MNLDAGHGPLIHPFGMMSCQ